MKSDKVNQTDNKNKMQFLMTTAVSPYIWSQFKRTDPNVATTVDF